MWSHPLTYHVSLHCPFDYCLPHSSQLNLSTPDLQCQFNRSGVLCGQCQNGLGTMFGSSQCKHCSNIYLLIIMPIGIAGVVLVLLLFTLNLTVKNGDINSFLQLTLLPSIFLPFFQPEVQYCIHWVSLLILIWEIKTCFYYGLDDYAKMWLRLAFPMYLIFIATLIIITSRYPTTIERLTARTELCEYLLHYSYSPILKYY